jgi:hypothetical protein
LYATGSIAASAEDYNRQGRRSAIGAHIDESMFKKKLMPFLFLLLSMPLGAQEKRLWVLGAPGEMTEYDTQTFAPKQTVKVPQEALAAPQSLSTNRQGQILFVPALSLPLDEGDLTHARKIWFWDGHQALTFDREAKRTTGATGSNLSITESAPAPYLAADGSHLFWFSNQARRLQRDGVDLSTANDWKAWQTDLADEHRQDLASFAMPDCSCPTGSCEDSCTYTQVWAPDAGVASFFLLTQFVAGKDQPSYKSTSLYQESSGKWSSTDLNPPLRQVLDAPNPGAMLEAIPDTGCCGWANQSNDQTVLRLPNNTLTVFDERKEYKNPDYDVSFYTANGRLSAALDAVALTIVATSEPNKPIQLSEQGQGNPEESERIRKALLELPAVEIVSLDANGAELPRRVEFLPHSTLVGWLTDKEILLVEDHLLAAYNVATRTRRKTNIRVEDAAHVFLR